jgi:uncharacterized membrane protein
MFEALFQWLFKYRPLVFEQGDFVFGASRGARLAVLAVAALAAYALFTYSRVGRGTLRDRVLLMSARVAALALLAFALLRPALVLKAAVPQQNFLGVLIDDSKSMQIADRGGEPRSEFVRTSFGTPESPLLGALASRFVLRPFRFSASADRIESAAGLTYNGTRTDLGRALERARDELAGLPLAGLVVVSDGADTSNAALDEPIASLKARSIPVFTVGVGQDHFSRDIQVSRLETPRSALKGTALVVNIVVTQTGYAGAQVPLQVEDEGHLIASQDVTLPPDGQSATVPVRFTVNEAGARVFRFRIPPQNGEQVTQNNTRDAMIEVSNRREKIVYYEGEPRPEPKFVRRAVEDDKNIQMVILQRTADDKYLRLNVDTPDELVNGFPKTREELFKYRGLIIGSVEASSFTPEQLRMIADFVSRRGGGLMMLGGRRSFVEGGWAGTPVAEVLPVVLENEGGRKPPPYFSEILVRPTLAGSNDPITTIAATPDASADRWKDMPPLTAVNAIRDVKPGATVLLTGADTAKKDQVVLAYQRYGRGRAMAFTIQDSWLWKMHAKIPVNDTTHATFWRRLSRWLVDGVPDQVMVTTTADRVDPGEAVKLTAQVVDSGYVDVNDSQVSAHVTAPSGKTFDVPMDWSVSRDGEYRASFVPDEEGTYDVRVGADRAGKELGTGDIHVRSAKGDSEYFDAAMRAPLLRRIAEETGGRFFTPDTSGGLPEAISYTGHGVTVVEERDLWDMPVLLLLVIALTGGEWAYRRARGLA